MKISKFLKRLIVKSRTNLLLKRIIMDVNGKDKLTKTLSRCSPEFKDYDLNHQLREISHISTDATILLFGRKWDYNRDGIIDLFKDFGVEYYKSKESNSSDKILSKLKKKYCKLILSKYSFDEV